MSNNVSSGSPAAFTNGDKIGVGYDASNGQITFYKNGVSQGSPYTLTAGTSVYFAIMVDYTAATVNFGATPFSYLPTGYTGWYY